MKSSGKQRMGLMGKFHNDVVELVDTTQLTPPEIIIVLRMLANEIERLFSVQAQSKGKK